jgi:hypothetical protein
MAFTASQANKEQSEVPHFKGVLSLAAKKQISLSGQFSYLRILYPFILLF